MSWWNSISLFDYLIIGILLLFSIYKWLTWNHDYFAKRDIPFCKPLPLVGNGLKNVLKLQSFADWIQEIYESTPDHKVVGMFQFNNPALVIRDPELLKQITVKDFDHFMDHKNILPDGVEPLFAANLFTLKGQKWKYMRALLSPTFTSSKMKGMFHLMTECGQQVVDHLHTRFKESGKDMLDIDIKDMFTRFTNDVIATTAFGISCDSLKNPINEFYMCGKDISNFSSGLRALKLAGYLVCPRLMKLFNIGLFSENSRNFLYNTVTETIKMREKEGIVRADMIHLLMQARKGELKDDDDETNDVGNKETPKAKSVKYVQKEIPGLTVDLIEDFFVLFSINLNTLLVTVKGVIKIPKYFSDTADTPSIYLTDTDITGQVMIFFLAGFDTTAVLLSFAALLLAMHQDVQKRLQEEIDQTLEDCGGQITYDGLQKMKYLDMVISETLRMYPPAAAIDRECVKPYTIPATDNTPEIIIKAKDQLIIPMYAIHRDPVYYPDPEKFDPERFSDENKHNIKPFTYIPFGIGPRSCIGNRFALMEDKIALLFLFSQFSLHVTEKSPVPIKLAASGFQMMPEKGFWLGIKKRQRT